jgi:hypothetical protein
MRRLVAYLALFITTFAVRVCAQSSSGSPAWYEGITVNGFVSAAFTYNLNRPDTGRNRFRVFDGADNTFTVDVFELSLKRDATEPGATGFRVDLAAGASIPGISHSSGMNTGDVDLQQMYVSWMAPIGNGLRLDLGKFVTHLGYEVIEGYDGFNDNYSRSFLFGYAIPFAHTGLRAAYAFSPSLSIMAMAVNGWDNSIDNNKSKTVGAQLFVSPIERLNVYGNVVFGPERDGDNSGNRSVIDLCASYSPIDALLLGFNTDIGKEEGLGVDGGDVAWTGFAGYLRFTVTERFAICLRGEMFDDADGARTGIAQKLSEVTVTPEYRPSKNMVFRAEFRMDMSDKPVFQKAGEYKDSQATIAINALYAF